jgi:hypothetical protein
MDRRRLERRELLVLIRGNLMLILVGKLSFLVDVLKAYPVEFINGQ